MGTREINGGMWAALVRSRGKLSRDRHQARTWGVFSWGGRTINTHFVPLDVNFNWLVSLVRADHPTSKSCIRRVHGYHDTSHGHGGRKGKPCSYRGRGRACHGVSTRSTVRYRYQPWDRDAPLAVAIDNLFLLTTAICSHALNHVSVPVDLQLPQLVLCYTGSTVDHTGQQLMTGLWRENHCHVLTASRPWMPIQTDRAPVHEDRGLHYSTVQYQSYSKYWSPVNTVAIQYEYSIICHSDTQS